MNTTRDRYYTVTETANRFGVNPKTITRWVKADRIPYITTPTGRRKFPADKIDALIDQDTAHNGDTR